MSAVLILPQFFILPYAYSLTKLYSNNIAKYNTLTIGLQIAEEMGVKCLEA